ncbi:helix-turn-helix domain-containing protein [Thermophagus sp. OGC60D27]|uniref:helix-turn-helix domain-containing protein n=1 Tax=Thermophagus sp. OGC60D27 TaxID=3458415 RepID=UPI004037CE42
MIYSSINNLFIILFFGALVILAFVFFTNPLGINKKGNRAFSLFLLLYASFWLEEVVSFSGFSPIHPLFLTTIHGLQIFTPPALYFSILYYSRPHFKIDATHSLHLVLPVLYIAIRFLIRCEGIKWPFLKPAAIIVILSQSLLYVILSYIKIRQHRKNILQYSSNTKGINLNWLEYIVIQIILLCLIIIWHNIFVSTTDLNLFTNSLQLVTVFIIAYFSLRQKEIFPDTRGEIKDLFNAAEKPQPSDATHEKKKVLPDSELVSYQQQLEELMQVKEPHLDSDLNLLKLAALLEVTPHQLSYIINTGLGENFFRFVNRHRVEKAKELLKKEDPTQTMIGVAFDSGFNSKTAFNTTFKKLTGMTPSEYKTKVGKSQ